MSYQEMFDKAVRGVIAQGSLAVGNRGACFYLTRDGKKCAVGQLLTEEQLKKLGEDGRLRCRVAQLIQRYDFFPEDQEKFLQELQKCHDRSVDVKEFIGHAKKFAGEYDLTFPKELA